MEAADEFLCAMLVIRAWGADVRWGLARRAGGLESVWTVEDGEESLVVHLTCMIQSTNGKEREYRD